MPRSTTTDALMQSVAQGTAAQLAILPVSMGQTFNTAELLKQIVSDRLELAGSHLRTADSLSQSAAHRSAISRYYYAMYHAARAICFGYHRGDDFQRHSRLPNNLPPTLTDNVRWTQELHSARLVRNMADYDLYPSALADWEGDAVALAIVAPEFLGTCEDFAMNTGLI